MEINWHCSVIVVKNYWRIYFNSKIEKIHIKIYEKEFWPKWWKIKKNDTGKNNISDKWLLY